jgi:hypothetical protein
MKMFAMAGLVFAADVFAVVLIVFSLWLENWLGLERDAVLDFIFVAAVCYGLAGWIVGRILMPEFRTRVGPKESAGAVEHPAHPIR